MFYPSLLRKPGKLMEAALVPAFAGMSSMHAYCSTLYSKPALPHQPSRLSRHESKIFGLTMRFCKILLMCSLFADLVIAAPMWKGKASEEETYGSVNLTQTTESHRRISDTVDNNSKWQAEQERSSKMPTAVDPVVNMREGISINASEALINQKIIEAEDMVQKWTALLGDQPSFINDQEREAIVKEVTADLEYWIIQKAKADEWISESNLDTRKKTLFFDFSQAVGEAIKEVNKVAEPYTGLFGSQQGKLSSFNAGVHSALISDLSHQSLPLSNDSETKVSKIPSKLCPLKADNLKEVLETWHGSAEIRYDSSAQKYVSERSQPNTILDMIRSAVGRTLLEREQHEEAIEKASLDNGLQNAARFKNHFSIRMKRIFGEPITPTLVKKVQEDLKHEDRIANRAAMTNSSNSSVFRGFLEDVAARWESFRQRRNGYQIISEN